MRHIRKSTAAATVGLGALALLAVPSFAATGASVGPAGVPVQLAHMGQGQGGHGTGQPCPMGMMGQGMMAPGQGGQGKMDPGTGGQGMMRPGFGTGPGLGGRVVPNMHLTSDDVSHFLEHRLEMHGNKRLKVGEVKEAGEDKIVADITTIDGSLVERLEVDRHTGQMQHVE